MNTEHYKAAAEATDADERALIPTFKRTVTTPRTASERPAPNKAQQGDQQGEERSFDTPEGQRFFVDAMERRNPQPQT